MRPLPRVSLGLLVLVLTVPQHGYDLLADPVGWLLIGAGVAGLRLVEPDRRRLLGLVWLAGAISALVWPGPVAAWLSGADPSLAWAASLPQVAVAVVLCTRLAALARRSGDAGAARLLDVSRTLSAVAGVLPVLVIGGHLDALDAAAEVVSVAAPVLLFVLLLRYPDRPWAAGREAEAPRAVRPG